MLFFLLILDFMSDFMFNLRFCFFLCSIPEIKLPTSQGVNFPHQDTCIGGLWRSEELACAYPVGPVKTACASGGFAAGDGPNMVLAKRLYLISWLHFFARLGF